MLWSTRRPIVRLGLGTVVALAVILIAGCAGPQPAADPYTLVTNSVDVEVARDYLLLVPRSELGGRQSAVESQGLIFIPGGLVEPGAYLTLLVPIAESGYPVIITRPLADLAILSANQTTRVLKSLTRNHPELSQSVAGWAIGGHSLGGVTAARYVARKVIPDLPTSLINGLVLLAAYPSSSDDLSTSGFPVLSVSASEDQLTTQTDIEESRALLPPDTAFVTIQGGNHAGFGDYGVQDGDGDRRISLEDQHSQIRDLLLRFLGELVQTSAD